MTTYKVGYFIGSLANASINRQLATALINSRLANWRFARSRSRTCRSTATTTTPTFPRWPRRSRRRSPSGRRALRHARVQPLDPRRSEERHRLGQPALWKNSFARKPSAVIGTSPGAIGTAVAQQSLRSVLSFCNAPQMNAPEAYIQFKPGLIIADGG